MLENPEDIVKVADEVDVKILSISSTERHLGLSLKATGNKSEKVEEKKEEITKEELATAVDSAVEAELESKE